MESILKENPKISALELEKRLDGNLCRCTGYRPIFEAFKSFSTANGKQQSLSPSCCSGEAGMGDIEELGCKKVCGKVCPPRKVQVSAPSAQTWITATTLQELYNLLDTNVGKRVKLVVGNTSQGVYFERFDLYIDISKISELTAATASKEQGGAVFGAAVTINNMKMLLAQFSKLAIFTALQTRNWKVLIEHMERVATDQVRNVASWAGNLVLSKEHKDFVSDLATIFSGVGARLTIGGNSGVSEVSMHEFYNLDLSKKVILSIRIPLAFPGENFKTYKVAQV